MNKKVFFVTLLTVMIAAMGVQLAIVAPLNAQDAAERTPTVKIQEIVQDENIKGNVANLENPQKYKVLVYVHTDAWYIHPYADQDEGSSWAAIKADGSWSIPTVKRQWNANKVAALVVDLSGAEDAPSKLNNLGKIKNLAVIVYNKAEMREKDWYKKL